MNSMVDHITLKHTRMIQNQPKTITIGKTLGFLIINDIPENDRTFNKNVLISF